MKLFTTLMLARPSAPGGPLLPSGYATNGLGSNWQNKLDEEFPGSALDSKFVPFWFSDNNTQNATLMKASNVVVNDGLVLTLAADSSGGLISSNPSGGASPGFDFVFGYIEFSFTLPNDGVGKIAHWPSVWITGQAWPDTGEFDIVEEGAGVAGFHYHYRNPATGNHDVYDISLPGVGPGKHIGGLDWESGQATLYIDNVAIKNPTRNALPTIQSSDLNGGAVLTSSRLYIVAEIALGSGPKPSVFPLDYIRVWQRPAVALAGTASISTSVIGAITVPGQVHLQGTTAIHTTASATGELAPPVFDPPGPDIN